MSVCSLLTVVGALVAGCAPDGEAPTGTRRVGTVDLTIGPRDGDDVYAFGRVGGVALGDGGRMYVADAEAHDVRVFDRAGTYLFRFGGPGGALGRLNVPCCLAFDPDGLLWIRDSENGRYTAFAVDDTSAAFVATRLMSHFAGGFWNPTTFDSRGNLIDVGSAPGGTRRLPATVRHYVNADNIIVRADTLRPPPPDSVGTAFIERFENGARFVRIVQQPFGPRLLEAHSPTAEWARAVSDRYLIQWFRADGELLHTIFEGHVAPPVTEEERRAARERLSDRLARINLTLANLPFDVAERHPVVADLRFDRLGRLWVELTGDPSAPRRARVYARNGNLAFEAEWPADISFDGGVLDEAVWVGVRRDTTGVESVVRLAVDAGS